MQERPLHITSPPCVEGGSYSLFGDTENTRTYYAVVEELLDELLPEYSDTGALYTALRLAGKRTRRTRFGSGRDVMVQGAPDREQLRRIDDTLSRFTRTADAHHAQLSWRKRRDRVIGMTRRQLHLAMLEAALVNRMQRAQFAEAEYRIALLPHCLRTQVRECKAESDGVDLRCRKCSKDCFVRHISDLLEAHDIVPYIWMSLGRRALFRTLFRQSARPGVLGIACVPELRQGMRLCLRNEVAVVGLPLNANRCARWMGELQPNSFALEQLVKLLG